MTFVVIPLLRYTPTPLQEIHDKSLTEARVRVIVKREDLNHPYISGNKWWKLKFNLQEATIQKKSTLLTFGGAFSNHIFATAAAANELGFKSIGIIRGEETHPLNATLSFAKQCGMHIHYCTREDYRRKHEETFIQELKNTFGDFYLIPEGGSNELAVQGCKELGEILLDSVEINFDYLCLPVGTGGTMSGLIEGFNNTKSIIGFPVLKGADFLEHEIKEFLSQDRSHNFKNWKLDLSYHFGGYAKTTSALLDFIQRMKSIHNLPLDHVYTAKLVWAVMDYARKEKFDPGSTVLVLHTGGLQGSTV